MINPIDNKNVMVFIDTNVMEDYATIQKNKYIICDKFPESKAFGELIVFAKENELNNFKICIPEIVMKEIQHHLVFYFNNAKKAYCDSLDKYKRVFGTLFEENHKFIHNTMEEIISFVDSEAKSFQERYSDCVAILSHSNDSFPVLLNKAVAHSAPFSIAHNGDKEFSDAGFKDAVLWECLLHEAAKDNTLIILFSDDKVFPASIPDNLKDKVFVFSECKDVINKLREFYNLSEMKEIIQRFKAENYLLDRIMDFTSIKPPFEYSSVDILSVEPDSNVNDSENKEDTGVDDVQTYSIKANITVNGIPYYFSVRYDFSSNEVMNAEIEQEGE